MTYVTYMTSITYMTYVTYVSYLNDNYTSCTGYKNTRFTKSSYQKVDFIKCIKN